MTQWAGVMLVMALAALVVLVQPVAACHPPCTMDIREPSATLAPLAVALLGLIPLVARRFPR